MLKLANEGLVQATTEAKGRGRPKQIWALTEAGNARFPDRHQDLALRLLCNMNKTLPTDTMNEVLEATAQSTLEKYEEELKGITGLENRVSTLADIRNREGYMAEYINEGKSYLLIENHCPIQAAASCCSRFCRSEQEMFSTILGKQAKVERVEHILDGQRRCVYRITGK